MIDFIIGGLLVGYVAYVIRRLLRKKHHHCDGHCCSCSCCK